MKKASNPGPVYDKPPPPAPPPVKRFVIEGNPEAAYDFCKKTYLELEEMEMGPDVEYFGQGEQGMRNNQTKAPISMVLEAPHAIEGIARVLEFGARKYARKNWQRGLPVTEILDSMIRHQLAYLDGEDLDPESGLPHVDHIGCNALFLSEMYHAHPGMDDREEPVPQTINPGEQL